MVTLSLLYHMISGELSKNSDKAAQKVIAHIANRMNNEDLNKFFFLSFLSLFCRSSAL